MNPPLFVEVQWMRRGNFAMPTELRYWRVTSREDVLVMLDHGLEKGIRPVLVRLGTFGPMEGSEVWQHWPERWRALWMPAEVLERDGHWRPVEGKKAYVEVYFKENLWPARLARDFTWFAPAISRKRVHTALDGWTAGYLRHDSGGSINPMVQAGVKDRRRGMRPLDEILKPLFDKPEELAVMRAGLQAARKSATAKNRYPSILHMWVEAYFAGDLLEFH